MTKADELRAWLFRAISFEIDSNPFSEAGIRMGAGATEFRNDKVEELLQPFDVQARADALRMSSLFAVLFCFENSVRRLVQERLEERHGAGWWEQKVASSVRTSAEKTQKNAISNTWLDGVGKGMISFLTFGQLRKVIVDNWPDFEDLIPSQPWLAQRMDEIEAVRNYVAHSRTVSERELARLTMYIEDWNRQIGF
jgi:Swt1-like HEPN